MRLATFAVTIGFVGLLVGCDKPQPAASSEAHDDPAQAEEPALTAEKDPDPVMPPEPYRTLRLMPGPGASEGDLREAVAILNRRLVRTRIPGMAEVIEGGRIAVHIADEPTALSRAGALIVAGGHLRFQRIASERDMDTAKLAAEIERLTSLKLQGIYDAKTERFDAVPCEDPQGGGDVILVDNQSAVEGHYIASAEAFHRDDLGWAVAFELNPEGSDRFFQFTDAIKGQMLAVVLDGTAKRVFNVKTGVRGSGTMTRGGGYAEEDARELAALVSSGRLPIELELEVE